MRLVVDGIYWDEPWARPFKFPVFRNTDKVIFGIYNDNKGLCSSYVTIPCDRSILSFESKPNARSFTVDFGEIVGYDQANVTVADEGFTWRKRWKDLGSHIDTLPGTLLDGSDTQMGEKYMTLKLGGLVYRLMLGKIRVKAEDYPIDGATYRIEAIEEE